MVWTITRLFLIRTANTHFSEIHDLFKGSGVKSNIKKISCCLAFFHHRHYHRHHHHHCYYDYCCRCDYYNVLYISAKLTGQQEQ